MTFATFADWATVAGLCATIWVLWVTIGLKRSFLNRARLPEIRTDLEKFSTQLLKAIQASSSDDTLAACAKIHAALESTKVKLEKTERKRVSSLLKRIDAIRASFPFDPDPAKSIYTDLIGTIEMIKNVEKDVSWRP